MISPYFYFIIRRSLTLSLIRFQFLSVCSASIPGMECGKLTETVGVLGIVFFLLDVLTKL